MQVYDNIACESAPLADSHLANKAYVDAAVANGAGTASVSGESVVSIPAHSLISCDLEPTEDAHLVNKAYVDAAVAAGGGGAAPVEEPAALGRVVVVNTLSDAASHTGTSLRDAIAGLTQYANVLIKFAVSGTITLEQGEIEIPGYVQIDGENKITISGGNVSRLFSVPTKSVLMLNNIIITGGNGVGTTKSQTAGGAIYVNGVLYARGVTFTDNHLSGTGTNIEGGAIYLDSNGRFYGEDCTFSDNSAVNLTTETTGASARGGALYANSNSFCAVRCSFTRNRVEGAPYGYGGALMIASSYLCECVFEENTCEGSARRYGGAIYYSNGFGNAIDCEFINNSVAVADDLTTCIGGAIFTNPSFFLKIRGCSFTGNFAKYGSAVTFYGSLSNGLCHQIVHCVFDGNLMNNGGRGSAIYMYYANAKIEDCEFKNHSVGTGNLIYAYGYTGLNFTTVINRCKFFDNTGSFTGGGFVFVCNVSQTYLYNCVFKNNTFTGRSGYHRCVYVTNTGSAAFIQNCTFVSNTGGGAFYATANTEITVYNTVEYGHVNTSSKASSATLTASKFLSDKDSAGRDITYSSALPLFKSDGYTPGPASQVINAGLSANCDTTIDLLGNPRVVGTSVDLGAVEYQGA